MRVLEVRLLLLQEGNVLRVDVICRLKLRSADRVEALLQQDVVVNGEMGQEGAESFEVGLWPQDDVLVGAEE